MSVPLRWDMIRQITELIDTKIKIVNQRDSNGESIHQINQEYIHQEYIPKLVHKYRFDVNK